jgi:hypothetical protein
MDDDDINELILISYLLSFQRAWDFGRKCLADGADIGTIVTRIQKSHSMPYEPANPEWRQAVAIFCRNNGLWSKDPREPSMRPGYFDKGCGGGKRVIKSERAMLDR